MPKFGRKEGKKMALAGTSTLGVTFGWGIGTYDTKPTSFTQLTRINDIGEVGVTPNNIDASALEDYTTKYTPGRAETSDSVTITVNKTDATIEEWEAVVDAYNSKTSEQAIWFETITPGITKADFMIAAPPSKLPSNAKAQNSLSTIEITLTIEDYPGMDTAVAFTTTTTT